MEVDVAVNTPSRIRNAAAAIAWPAAILLSACSASADDTGPRDAGDADGEGYVGPCGDAGECPDGLTCCPMGCVDTRTDLENCGECDLRCALNEVCERGFCYVPECNPPCSPSMLCCGGDCVDFLNDEENCGRCGRRCQPGIRCMSGDCLCGGRTCATDEECCDGACVNVYGSDPRNCGRCGNDCGPLPCVDGGCVCGSSTCPTGWTCCDGDRCFDLSSDMEHCGTCSNRCESHLSTECRNGECLCGEEAECTWPDTYPWCPATPVFPPQRCCSGRCVTVDQANCARCGAGEDCQGYANAIPPRCEYECVRP